MTYDEAVAAIEGQLKTEGVRDDAGLRRALALFVLDAIGYRQTIHQLDWFQYQVYNRFHPLHRPTYPNHTMGKVYGDIREFEEHTDPTTFAPRLPASAKVGYWHPVRVQGTSSIQVWLSAHSYQDKTVGFADHEFVVAICELRNAIVHATDPRQTETT